MKNQTAMTREHFVFIANVLSDLRRTIPAGSHTETEHVLLDRVVYRFAVALNATNKAFDNAKFIEAAGG